MSPTRVATYADARRSRGEIGLDQAPATLDEAYAISAGVAHALDARIGGWKVGYAPDGTPVAAPMYASGFLPNGANWSLKAGRKMIPEIEIAVRLGSDLPPRPGKPYTRADIENAAAEFLIGIELIERRIPAEGAPFPMNLADDLGNVGYVTGATTTAFRGLDLATLLCRFWMGGALTTDRRGGHPKGDPLVPMIDWANAQRDQLGGMKAGQVVTLGSLTPMVYMPGPGPLAAEIEAIGRVEMSVV